MMTNEKKSLLPPDICEHISKWIERYPANEKRSGVFEALRVVQERNGGSLTTELMDAVAEFLGMPNIAVYEVAAFYSLYFLKPVGHHVVDICTNVPCMLSGGDKILAHCQKTLGIDVNETTADGKFTLREVECLGACITAPVCQIGKKYYESLTPQKIDEILERLSHE